MDLDMQLDRRTLAIAFRRIAHAATTINEVLAKNEHLNNTVPTDWPLNLSADEFAAECFAMADHYEAEAIRESDK
ncbi:MAG: hypothetical protein C5B60_09910 [Chloroflexi bacterium]|nr:MAG: hypothetical protein C5B60_09910 [Chloroflexota bacterium]